MLKVTFHTALWTAGQLLGTERVSVLMGAASGSPLSEACVPLDRAGAPVMAALTGKDLAELAVDMLPLDRVSAMRIGLDAVCILVAGSQLQTFAMRYQFADNGTALGRALLACARCLSASGDFAFALDLAAWARGVADNLAPFGMIDEAVRRLAEECATLHGEISSIASSKGYNSGVKP